MNHMCWRGQLRENLNLDAGRSDKPADDLIKKREMQSFRHRNKTLTTDAGMVSNCGAEKDGGKNAAHRICIRPWAYAATCRIKGLPIDFLTIRDLTARREL